MAKITTRKSFIIQAPKVSLYVHYNLYVCTKPFTFHISECTFVPLLLVKNHLADWRFGQYSIWQTEFDWHHQSTRQLVHLLACLFYTVLTKCLLAKNHGTCNATNTDSPKIIWKIITFAKKVITCYKNINYSLSFNFVKCSGVSF
jgi:hypothetical protein